MAVERPGLSMHSGLLAALYLIMRGAARGYGVISSGKCCGV